MSLFGLFILPAVLLSQPLAAHVLRRIKQPLQHSLPYEPVTNQSVSLKRLQLDLPAANSSNDDAFKGSLPVYLPSEDEKHPLVERRFLHEFSTKELTEMNYSKSHGLTVVGAGCTPLNTIFDLGFYDGADSTAYLSGGYCVVGVEADPDLVAQALAKYAVWVQTGQLRIANVAIAPSGDTKAWTVFYRNRCSKEWNSFIKTVGCRACQPPHAVDLNACDQVQVTSTNCMGIFGTFGVPHYLKLDIEGAEMGCFRAMQTLPTGMTLPHYVSAEITQLEYIDTLYKLGYRGFKLVRQDRLASAVGSTSGPWGENALDCATGPWWRDYMAIRLEFGTILGKGMIPTDACPGGVMPIHGEPKMQAAYMWYDLHASLTPPPPAAR